MKPSEEDSPAPRWQKVAAVVYMVAAAFLLVWFRGRLHADFWPLDNARIAPNITATLIQVAVATPVAVLVWPPTRRRVHRFVERHTEPIHKAFEHARLERAELHRQTLAAHTETQRHLAHIIKYHPEIPPLPSKETK